MSPDQHWLTSGGLAASRGPRVWGKRPGDLNSLYPEFSASPRHSVSTLSVCWSL